jgi:ATP-binding cassette subfamily B protein
MVSRRPAEVGRWLRRAVPTRRADAAVTPDPHVSLVPALAGIPLCVTTPVPVVAARAATGGDWHTIRTLLPYLWAYKGRVLAALIALIAAKVANVGVPVDEGNRRSPDATTAILAVPLVLLVAYGLLRLDDVLHRAREPVRQGDAARGAHDRTRGVPAPVRAVAALHPARQTGGLTRDVERGQRGISTLISFTLFSIPPTLVEISLVAAILVIRYD